MKLYGNLLALCVLHPRVWESRAFVNSPRSSAFKSSSLSSTSPFAPTITSSPTTVSTTNTPIRPVVSPSSSEAGKDGEIDKIWGLSKPLIVQGGTLKTWGYPSPAIERVQVTLMTEGRPLDADVDLWHGPDNVPQKMRVYVEDGSVRPFSCVVETPRGPNTIAIRNIGNLEFPMSAAVLPEATSTGSVVTEPIEKLNIVNTIQGGALRTYPFDPYVESVQVLLKTDGRPLNARIELLQGPNNNKQVVEIYTEDGMERPFFLILSTPSAGNVVRIVNTAPVEFPLTAAVQAFEMGDPSASLEPVIGGDGVAFF